MSNKMRLVIGQFAEASREQLAYAKQLGASGVLLNTPLIPGEKQWEVADLVWLRQRCEAFGLTLEALENTPVRFYDQAMLGTPGRDAQIAHYQQTIRNMAQAGVFVLGFHWMLSDVWRTSNVTPGRGGAKVTAFDAALMDQAFSLGAKDQPLARSLPEEAMWDNFAYFMKAVLPVAESVGVRLALHPDDPPLPRLGDAPRLFYHFEGFRRAIEAFDSPTFGLDFCMGTWSEMGPGVLESLQYFAERNKIVYVHFRDVQGHMPSFQECFLGEGNVDVVKALQILKNAPFEGFIIDDHAPRLVDDSEWGHRGHAFATGYIAGLLDAVLKLG